MNEEEINYFDECDDGETFSIVSGPKVIETKAVDPESSNPSDALMRILNEASGTKEVVFDVVAEDHNDPNTSEIRTKEGFVRSCNKKLVAANIIPEEKVTPWKDILNLQDSTKSYSSPVSSSQKESLDKILREWGYYNGGKTFEFLGQEFECNKTGNNQLNIHPSPIREPLELRILINLKSSNITVIHRIKEAAEKACSQIIENFISSQTEAKRPPLDPGTLQPESFVTGPIPVVKGSIPSPRVLGQETTGIPELNLGQST